MLSVSAFSCIEQLINQISTLVDSIQATLVVKWNMVFWFSFIFEARLFLWNVMNTGNSIGYFMLINWILKLIVYRYEFFDVFSSYILIQSNANHTNIAKIELGLLKKALKRIITINISIAEYCAAVFVHSIFTLCHEIHLLDGLCKHDPL